MLEQLGQVAATFDDRTQDSGHISYGVADVTGERWFVKSAGTHGVSPGGATRHERETALRHAAALQQEIDHPALVPLERVIEASDGVVAVYQWFEGELLRCPAERRDDPSQAYLRFRALPLPELVAALDTVIDLHVTLESNGWIAGDFYDGSLMYDFDTRQIKVIDLESYHRGPYVNTVGRLPGSTRFMAPEEWIKGARITATTTVYNLGRMLEIFLAEHLPHPALETVQARATATDPVQRIPSVAALQHAWRSALG